VLVFDLRLVIGPTAEFLDLGRLTLRESSWCVRLALWGEEQNRLVSFNEAVEIRCCGG
jgi:hypothetical protein